jgi:putative transposase
MTSKTTNKFSPEVRERAVRLVLDTRRASSRWAAVLSIAAKIGCTAQTLNEWVKKAEVDSGKRRACPTDDGDEAEGAGTREPRASAGQRDPAQGAHILPRRSSTAGQAMIAFIDDHREAHGVEPICKVLPIAPSTYHDHVAKRADPSKLSARASGTRRCAPRSERVFEENFEVYGVRKVWRQMQREGFDVARCTVARLMKDHGPSRRHPRQAVSARR